MKALSINQAKSSHDIPHLGDLVERTRHPVRVAERPEVLDTGPCERRYQPAGKKLPHRVELQRPGREEFGGGLRRLGGRFRRLLAGGRCHDLDGDRGVGSARGGEQGHQQAGPPTEWDESCACRHVPSLAVATRGSGSGGFE